ncbi:MAG: ceramidase domain-containing protein [Planctomycetota bacterium]
MSRGTRLALVFLPGLAGLVVLALKGPIPQSPAYHLFADQRVVCGVPHFGDVISNIPFLVVGAAGLLLRPSLPFVLFFLGVFATGLGSSYYHWEPNNATLVWDRLPMGISFMAIFGALFSERVSERWGRILLLPFVLAGAGSVVYWALTDDLRIYGFVQFYSLLAAILMLALLPSKWSHGSYYWIGIACYAGAKVTELLDKQIWELNGLVSGHNLKHLLAAWGAGWVLSMLRVRTRLD